MNRVQLVGRLGQDPELKTFSDGGGILNIRMATNERRKVDGDWVDHAEWHSVTVSGKRAVSLANYLSKGTQVAVSGRLQTRTWEAKDGSKRYSTEVRADDLEMLGSKGERSSGGGSEPSRDYNQPEAGGGGFGEDDIPFHRFDPPEGY